MSAHSPTPSSLHTASLSWNEAGLPVSTVFDDVYFSNDNGLAETQYVFLRNNGIPDRWPTHDRPLFVIGETGFGTGMNFLAVWQAFRAWRATQPACGAERLHFISFEKFPLSHADLARALGQWPALHHEAQMLLAQYPPATPGCHRLILDEGLVTLDLWFGDIKDTLDQVWHPLKGGLVDAWFLDGFAPSKNPDMWSEHLFSGLARLARTSATLATFTSAGFVRRGLQAAGFTMQKVKGHGNKREMLTGIRTEQPVEPIARKTHRQARQSNSPVSLIGGGIASAALAFALTRRGVPVELYCADPIPACGASGNPQGVLYPLLNAEKDAKAQFFSAAYGFARRQYQPLLLSQPIAHAWCGVLQFAHDAKTARKLENLKQAGWPGQWVQGVTPHERDQLAGVPLASAWSDSCVHYPDAGWLNPRALTQALLDVAKASGYLRIHYQCRVEQLTRLPDSWLLSCHNGDTLQATNLVLACGASLPSLVPTSLACYPIRGQISLPPAQAALNSLQSVLCADGYLIPVDQGAAVIGASHVRNDDSLDYRETEQQENLARWQRNLPAANWIKAIKLGEQARVSVRCGTRDHLPCIGILPSSEPPLWLLGALGARGLCSAPLAAELLASELCGEPLPLAMSLLDALHPARLTRR